jgi:hypothetical protein
VLLKHADGYEPGVAVDANPVRLYNLLLTIHPPPPPGFTGRQDLGG